MDILDQELFEDNVQQYFDASKGKRFANYLIDYITYLCLTVVFWIVVTLIAVLLGEDQFLDGFTEDTSAFMTVLEYVINAFVMIAYFTLVEHYGKGKSLGKLITKTRAVQRDGEQMSFSIALKRSACRVIPFDSLSFLGDVKNGWHDSIPGTKVIDENLPIVIREPLAQAEGIRVDPAEQFRLK